MGARVAEGIVKKNKTARPQIGVRPSAHAQKISRVFIVVTEMESGEGVYCFHGPQGETLPVLAVDDKDLVALSEYAREQAQLTGRTVSIIGFTKRTQHETFRPVSTGDKK